MPVPNIDAALKAGMSPADIMSSLGSKYPSLAPRMSAAEAAGHSPTAILTSLASAPASVFQEGSDSFGSALESGAGNAVSGLANVAGDAAGAVGLPGIAKSLRAESSALQNAGEFNGHPLTNLGSDIGNLVRGKNVLKSIENGGASLGNLAALQAPTVATALGLGAVTGGAGTAAYLGANAAGDTIEQRMIRQGQSAPSAGDYAAGAVNGAAQGALGAFGLGGLGAAGALPAVAAKSALLRGVSKIGLDSATSALGSVGNQLADSVGTPGGANVNLGAVEGAAAQGGAARALSLPFSDTGVQSVLPKGTPKPGLLEANSLASVRSMIDDAKAQIGGVNNQATHTQAVNSVFQNLDGELGAASRNLVANGYMTQAQKQDIFGPLMNQSGSHKNALGEVSDGQNPGMAATSLDQFMKLGMPPEVAAPIVSALRAREILSQNKNYKQMTGPLANLGYRVGQGAGLLGVGMAPEFPGKGLVAEFMGERIGGSVGKYLGGKADDLLRLSKPPIMGQSDTAAKVLAKAGVTPGPNSLIQLQQLNTALADRAQASASVATPGTAPAQANQLATIKQLGPDRPASKIAIQQLQEAGMHGPVNDALAHYAAMQPIKAALSQAQQDAAAQNAINAAAMRHQTNIAASDLLPTNDGVGITAQNAAVNEMVLKAQRSRALGGEAVPEDEPVSPPAGVGVPPVPPGGFAPQGQPGPAQSAPAAPQGQPAPLADAPPQMSPMGHPSGSLGDYLSHQALGQHDIPLAPPDLSAAIDSLMGDGSLRPNTGSILKQSLGQPVNNAGGVHDPVFSQILNRAVQMKGGPSATDLLPGLARAGLNWRAGVPNGGDNPVRNLYQYVSKAQTVQHKFDRVADAAGAQGHPALSNFLESIRANSKIAEKQALFRAFLKAHPGSAALASELGVQQLVDHGNSKTK